MGSKPKVKHKWVLSVSYNADDYFKIDVYEIEDKFDKLARKHGGTEYATGMGFGKRDLHYGGFLTKEHALKFYEKMKQVSGIPRLKRENLKKENDE